MDVAQLLAFDRVAREGSFSRAALALGLGQPAVSARIHALESEVGGALFVRRRQPYLTPLGEAFLPHARQALETLDDGVAAARLWQEGKRGRLRVGVLGSLAGPLAGPAVAALLRTRPEIECVVKAADHEVLLEMLLDGAIELAVLAWPATGSLAASLSPLLKLAEPVVLVAGPRHALVGRRRTTVDDVARLARPLLRLRWWEHHHPDIDRIARASGTNVEVPMETARHLVRAGVGAGFFTRSTVADDLKRGLLKEVRVSGMPALSRQAALVRRGRTTRLTPPAAALVDLLQKEAQRLRILA